MHIEGFTLVLMLSWIILISCFAGMYFLDKKTKEAAAKRAQGQGPANQATPRR
jgi:hypothetical protein